MILYFYCNSSFPHLGKPWKYWISSAVKKGSGNRERLKAPQETVWVLKQSFDFILIYFSEVPAQKPAAVLMQSPKIDSQLHIQTPVCSDGNRAGH